jgi:acyl-coenzyme A synthetase/AMP-(fatty) acid ligase
MTFHPGAFLFDFAPMNCGPESTSLAAARSSTGLDGSWNLNVPEHFNFATDVLDRWAQALPDAIGLWCVDAATGAEQKFPFKRLSTLSAQAANVFRSAGVRRADCVLIMLPRVPQWWIAMLGLLRLGAVPVSCTLLLTPRPTGIRARSSS